MRPPRVKKKKKKIFKKSSVSIKAILVLFVPA